MIARHRVRNSDRPWTTQLQEAMAVSVCMKELLRRAVVSTASASMGA